MAKVKEIIGAGQNNVISLSTDKSVADAINLLVDNDIGALLIVENEKPVGMFTERDVIKCWSKKGDRFFKDIKVSEVMSTNMIIAKPDDDIFYVTSIMVKNKIRHLPVLDNNKIVAMLSIRDIAKAQLMDLMAENRYLKDYISDKYPG